MKRYMLTVYFNEDQLGSQLDDLKLKARELGLDFDSDLDPIDEDDDLDHEGA